jgi:transcriptional regulator of arginine metabolism
MYDHAVPDRRRLIASLLDRFPVTSQPQLVSLLADQGVHVTQATVSRDLERLGAVRVRRDGHLVYALPAEEEPADPAQRLREALLLVRSMEPSGNLAVLKTAPANAMPVARAFDVAHLPEVAGTVAGDDVVLVVAREPYSGAHVLELCDRIGTEASHAHA